MIEALLDEMLFQSIGESIRDCCYWVDLLNM